MLATAKKNPNHVAEILKMVRVKGGRSRQWRQLQSVQSFVDALAGKA